MKIVRYDIGDQAGHDVDCVKIERRPDGRANLTGTVLSGKDSVSMVGSAIYQNADDAEAAGLAWAESLGCEELHLEIIDTV